MRDKVTEMEAFEERDLFDEDDYSEEEINSNEDEIVPEKKESQQESILEDIPEKNKLEEHIPEEDMPQENILEEDILEETIAEETTTPITNLMDVINSINELTIKVEDMHKLFIKKIEHTEFEEKIVDQMHAELQIYKDDMYSRLVRPILLDIIEVRDSILRIAKVYADKPEGKQGIPNKVFVDYALDIQDILENNEIEIYQSSVNQVFVPVKQKAIKKINTDNEQLHGKVAESMSSGYIYKGRTISPEKVVVYSYEKLCEKCEK